MEGHIHLSLQSIVNKINKNERRYCFEIFGYDVIIDEVFNVWLIEINTNPCIEESSPLLKQYVHRMIDDAFKLTIDKLFPYESGKINTQGKEINNQKKLK